MSRPKVRYAVQSPVETRAYGTQLTDQLIMGSTAILTDPDGVAVTPPVPYEQFPSLTATYLVGPLTKTGVWNFTIRTTLEDGQFLESIWKITSHVLN